MAMSMLHRTPKCASGELDGRDSEVVWATYKLIVSVSVALPEERVDDAVRLLEAAFAHEPVDVRAPATSNAREGESEVGLVVEVLNRPPRDDRVSHLREGALLGITASALDVLYDANIPCRIIGWGVRDPQRDRW